MASTAPSATLAGGRITRRQGRAWTAAVFAVFAIDGLSLSSWMVRIPAVRDLLGASTLSMGLLVVGLSCGSMVGLGSSSHLIARFGAKHTMTVASLTMLVGLAFAGVGTTFPSYSAILIGLFVFGLGTSTTDVAMNLSGAANERVMGRTLMPLFHALFSLGTVGGAGLGALAARVALPVVWHLAIVAIVGVVSLSIAVRHVQPESLSVEDDGHQSTSWRERIAVWKQSATLLIGLIMLGMAFAEGAAGDWLALAMVDKRGTTNAGGAVIYGVFVAAMTVGRVVGVPALDRFGRVPVLRASAVSGAIGLCLVIFVPSVPMDMVGTVLWGLGASLGFPVGMSAAADDPRNAAARVSAVATIGYLAFLVGPPVLGFLGGHVGLLNAFILVLVLIAVAAFVAPAARERRNPPTQPDQTGRWGRS
ncbi:MAG: MFS transporter [Actinomycetota bacterium]|nr:MFS transporter [Actinomycetota bacterium]